MIQEIISAPKKIADWRFTFQIRENRIISFILTLTAPAPQNSQTHSNNSSAVSDELFGCI